MVGDIVDLGVELGLLTKSGAFYSYGDLRIGQGRENAKSFLADNPDLAMTIETDIRREAGLPPGNPPVAAAEPALAVAR